MRHIKFYFNPSTSRSNPQISGRLINLGAQVSQHKDTSNLAAHTAGRYAVEGASAALRHEMRPLGVNVVTLQPEGLPIARLFATPCIP